MANAAAALLSAILPRAEIAELLITESGSLTSWPMASTPFWDRRWPNVLIMPTFVLPEVFFSAFIDCTSFHQHVLYRK